MAQSQYATTAQMQLLAITPAAFARFEAASPGCVTAAIQAASSIADASLSSQFEMPLQTSPSNGWDMSLTKVVCFLAAWDLYSTFGYNPSAPDWQIFEQRKQWADKWLDGVAKKTITPLFLDSSGLAPDADRAGDFIVSDQPVGFTDRGTNFGTVGNGCGGWFW